jgi:hypothetical protein
MISHIGYILVYTSYLWSRDEKSDSEISIVEVPLKAIAWIVVVDIDTRESIAIRIELWCIHDIGYDIEKSLTLIKCEESALGGELIHTDTSL